MIKRDYLYNELFENNARSFVDHLLVPYNERIIFSGKFGTGKTTFLNEFFQRDNQESHFEGIRFNTIKVYPVNYSIANNQDIFEYIKYDILIEMLVSNQYKFEGIDITYWQNLSFEIAKHPEKLTSLVLSMIPRVGKQLNHVYKEIVSLKKELDESFKKNKKQLNEHLQVDEFLSKFSTDTGGLYESDLTTNLIKTVLHRAKETTENHEVENVLIIDDLDRIDPEHIFRILNVFAAHFDKKDSLPNKFGFDKVIIVCDINNIREIFSTKYGINTDFNGYIDKFYSSRIFEYSIHDQFARIATRVIFKSNWTADESSNQEDEYCTNLKKYEQVHVVHGVFNSVIEMLTANRQLDIRNIKKYEGIALLTPDTLVYNSEHIDLGINVVLMRLYQLSHVFGNFSRLKEAINKSIKPFYIRSGDLNSQIKLLLISLYRVSLYDAHELEIRHTVNGRDIFLVRQDKQFTLTDKKQTQIVLTEKDFRTIIIDTINFLSDCEIYHHK